jgi:hypothetical protein
MVQLPLFRRLVSGNRVWLLALTLFIAQLSIAGHPLHSDRHDTQKVEDICVYCAAGAHLQSVPVLPVVNFRGSVTDELIVTVRHLCSTIPPVFSRLTRGPPSTTPCK